MFTKKSKDYHSPNEKKFYKSNKNITTNCESKLNNVLKQSQMRI